MNSETIFIVVLLASIVGGTVGAKISDADAWKGAVAVIAGAIVNYTIAVAFPQAGSLVIGIAAIVAVGIAGAAMQLNGRQVASVVLGSFLLSVVTTLVIGSMATA